MAARPGQSFQRRSSPQGPFFSSGISVLSALLKRRADPKALRLQFLTKLAYVWGFVTAKMSFAALYLRLLPGHVSRRINQVLLAVLVAEGVEVTIAVVFQCKPMDKV